MEASETFEDLVDESNEGQEYGNPEQNTLTGFEDACEESLNDRDAIAQRTSEKAKALLTKGLAG